MKSRHFFREGKVIQKNEISRNTVFCFVFKIHQSQANKIIPKQLRNGMMISSQNQFVFMWCVWGFGRLWHVWPAQRSVIDWRSSRRAVCSSSYSSSILPRHFLLFFSPFHPTPPTKERECLRPFDYNPLLYISPSSASVPHLTYSLLFTNFLFKKEIKKEIHLQFLKNQKSRAHFQKKIFSPADYHYESNTHTQIFSAGLHMRLDQMLAWMEVMVVTTTGI